MKKSDFRFQFVLTTCLAITMVCVSLGDWDPPDGHKMHYPQMPDLAGWDVEFTSLLLYDDWQCTETGPVSDIHFWFSSLQDQVFELESIHVKMHRNDPNLTQPAEVLWHRVFGPGEFTVRRWVNADHGWFRPGPTDPVAVVRDHMGIWQANIMNIPEPFVQELGSTYWLNIKVEATGPDGQPVELGWDTSVDHFGSAGLWSCPGCGLNPLLDPITNDPLDLAFVITTQRQPKPLIEDSKWSQPPIEIDPSFETPLYCGWDEPSYAVEPDIGGPVRIVADDFRCLGKMPVTSVHWWGSHVGWEEPVPPQPEPIAWRIAFWTNVPADPAVDPPYSRPGVMLWRITVPADRVQREFAGYDQFPLMPPDSCFQYLVKLEPQEYFWQDRYNASTTDNVYWISIMAVYPPGGEPQYPWGWKTKPWNWMDKAVRIGIAPEPVLGTVLEPEAAAPILDPASDRGFDAAFELDTDPAYIKWQQHYTGIRHWPHYEDERSMARATPGGIVDFVRVVADDWRCETRTPVTAAAWWGSYIGYRYEPCQDVTTIPPIKPDYFLLTIWNDISVHPPDQYAVGRPGEIIWQYMAHDYDQVLVGYDKHPHDSVAPPREPVFRYSVRLPRDAWFCQDGANNHVYWFSVVAVYDQNTPTHDWGWTNHRHNFRNDAVAAVFDPCSLWLWEELYDQTGASEDMSFILYTDPDATLCTCWDLDECAGQPFGDASCNGWISLSDLYALKRYFGKAAPWTDPECCADFTHDGQVNLGDLFVLRRYFGLGPYAPAMLNQKCP
jgi:hypothetical protein